MPDNNPNARASYARLIGNVFARQFTSTFEIGGASFQVCLTELAESDKLEIAGREIHRAQGLMALAANLVGVKLKEGMPVTLDGDPDWQVLTWHVSPDGATYSFALIDGK